MHREVIGHAEARTVHHAGVGVVARHIPSRRSCDVAAVEPQVLSSVVDVAAAEKPYALQVERHIDFLARVGIVAEHPDLVERRVVALHPHVADEHIGLDFVIVATVDHHLLLRVQVAHRPLCLSEREEPDGIGRGCQAQHHHNYNQCNAFHGFNVLIVHRFSTAKVQKLSDMAQKKSIFQSNPTVRWPLVVRSLFSRCSVKH